VWAGTAQCGRTCVAESPGVGAGRALRSAGARGCRAARRPHGKRLGVNRTSHSSSQTEIVSLNQLKVVHLFVIFRGGGHGKLRFPRFRQCSVAYVVFEAAVGSLMRPSFSRAGWHLQPGRIADAGVGAPPDFLQTIFRRRGRVDARRHQHGMTVPMRTRVPRQDRPRHVGEAAREERRRRCHDVMRRLEPGDVMRFCSRPISRKRSEACILCWSRCTAFAIAMICARIRIARDR